MERWTVSRAVGRIRVFALSTFFSIFFFFLKLKMLWVAFNEWYF